MKPGARLINVSRAEIVEREALQDALASGHLGGFALDPLYEAPGRADDRCSPSTTSSSRRILAAQPRFNALDDFADLISQLNAGLKP